MDLDNLQTFYGLFSNWRFHVPDYQRGYAWEKDQWQDLMDDLSTLTDDNDHFTGLLVLHKNKDPNLQARALGIVKDVFDVVDGQQRLTTVLILLNEIRREMLAIGTPDLVEIAEGIQQSYLYEPGSGGLMVYKLILDRNNNSYFIHNILGTEDQNIIGPQIQSHKNLLGARDFFQAELLKKHELMGDAYPSWLENFYGKVANQMKLMVYHLRSEADAGVVFETMNSRGKKPNQLDLVKNYLLFLASKLDVETRRQLSGDINDAWKTIFEQLSAADRPEDEDTLLEMHWVTTYDHDRKRWASRRDKSDHVKNHFKAMIVHPEQHAEMATEVAEYVQTLKNTSITYRDILQPEHSEAFQIFSGQPDLRMQVVRSSEKLVRLGILRPFIPLLVAIRLKFPEDAQIYFKFVQLCEKYAFRVFRIANRRLNSAEAVLFRLANQLYNNKMNIETVLEGFRRNLLASCSDELLMQSFDTSEINPWYGRSGTGLKYFLFEYEENLFGGSEPIFKWSAVIGGKEKTIEHILPQNPEKEGYWADRFTPDEIDNYKYLMGNLTLTEDNSCLGNKSFPEKKGKIGQRCCYANSIIKIERELAALDDWTPKEIEERQYRLAEWALKRWYIDPVAPELPPGFEAQSKRAEYYGVVKEFEQIYELSLRVRLQPSYPRKNCMTYSPPGNQLKSVLTVYSWDNALEVYVRPHNFPKYKNVSQERIREIFENKTYFWLPLPNVIDFIAKLQSLADEIGSE